MAVIDEFIVFEYMYRDAGNYKAFGQVLLRGARVNWHWQRIEAACNENFLFVAEQVGLPPLYEELYAYSGGMVADDIAFHEIQRLRGVNACEMADDVWGAVEELTAGFVAVAKRWDCRLSPHAVLPIGDVP